MSNGRKRDSRTQESFVSNIDREKAIKSLEELGVENPTEKLGLLSRELPEILDWYNKNGRDYPWRNTSDPWRVFVAEVFLRKTRAEQVEPVYEEFVQRYPSPEQLLESEVPHLEDLIETLGLVDRRKEMLLTSAKVFVQQHDGAVPDRMEHLKEINGIGNYIAGATLLYGHQQPKPMVDPNIIRSLEDILGFGFPDRYHKNENVMSFMDAITPGNPETARKFYLSLLDYGAKIK